MSIVADAGPLIALAKIEALELLVGWKRPVVIAPAVYRETVEAGLAMSAPDSSLLKEACEKGDLLVQPVRNTTMALPDFLGEGEKESLKLAMEMKSDWLLMDDLDARRIAEETLKNAGLATKIKGTLGVIVAAAERKQLSRGSAVNKVATLKSRPDIWLNSKLCDQVIRVLEGRP